jgi:ABC-type branched-subunit amino acid transport system permease subunit
MNRPSPTSVSRLPALLTVLLGTVFAAFALGSESQWLVFGLLIGGGLGLLLVRRLGWLEQADRSTEAWPRTFSGAALMAVIAVCLWFHDDPFVLFLIATVLVYTLACFGLNIQFGFVGVVNFAGASFLGVGCYTAAILTKHTAVPHVLVLLAGGLAAALIGSILLVPVLKTRGHYAALVTIAFALLFKIFLEVNDVLGGPQGLKSGGLKILGWDFNRDLNVGSFSGSFYLGYIGVILLLTVLGFIVARRLEESWLGLNLDAVRLDETSSACFGLHIPRWKITAFTIGNFYCGVVGAIFAMMLGYIAPANFAFGDSLILISIIILGGLGSLWGTVAATAIVVILPEKFQILQEYRFLIYAALVIVILLFRPQGLVPRSVRRYASLRRGGDA